MNSLKYDVVVVGGGHAGIEAAMAASGMGLRTALITLNIEMIGHMPCNPAMGGLGKSQLIRETDALGGWIGRLSDATAIQFRVLNLKKGAAVHSLRTQNDKQLYRAAARKLLETRSNIDVIQDEVSGLILDSAGVKGLTTVIGNRVDARAVIVTTGTFLNGLIHVGLVSRPAGRLGEMPSGNLSESIRKTGIEMGRLKTGTPARLDFRSIRFDHLEPQPGDQDHPFFSHWMRPSAVLPQINCYLTYTNSRTHQIIRDNLDRSPLYGGVIKGIGPRYCPSIEDKIVRFPDKEQHQIFLEPEGLETIEIYANGISTSLPIDVQEHMIHSIEGLEKAKIIRPAYAVEYDFVFPEQLTPALESKTVPYLYFAGQINGTSGYEEAAAQGLMAGINAALKIKESDPLILTRDQAYIAVMIDDLVTRGVDEPYRMFTSRAEYRLMLRSDNADSRLTPVGYRLGLISEEQYQAYSQAEDVLKKEYCRLSKERIVPSPQLQEKFRDLSMECPVSPVTLQSLLKRPGMSYKILAELDAADPGFPEELVSKLENLIYYEGYIENQKHEVEQFRKMEGMPIPADINYEPIPGLSREVRQKLTRVRPSSLGQALRIPGMTPAAVSILSVWIKHKRSDRSSGA